MRPAQRPLDQMDTTSDGALAPGTLGPLIQRTVFAASTARATSGHHLGPL